MRNKKNFNNLYDSICITIFLVLNIVFYTVAIWFSVIRPNEGTNPIAALVCFTIIFGSIILSIIIVLIKLAYSYWILLDDSIIFKKIFSKSIIIKFSEIDKVEKKKVTALILGSYKCEAYLISSGRKKICILIRKNIKDLELLEKEIAKFF